MSILASHVSIPGLVFIYLLFVLVTGIAIYRAPWYHLQERDSLNILLAMIVGVMVVWTMRAGFAPGLDIHLVGATLLTLMFGWEFATLAIILVLIVHNFYVDTSWLALPVNALLVGALPSIVSQGIFRLSDRLLPNNFFIYIFVCAFFGAAIAVSCIVLVTSSVHWLSDTYSWSFVWQNYTRYIPLMMVPEAFVTGMLMSLFVIYRPQWVSSFDDSRYLDNK